MDEAEVVGATSAAGPVVMLVMALVVVGVPAADHGEACPGSSWLKSDGLGSWSPSSSEEVNTTSAHVPAVTTLTWDALREEARKVNLELPQDGVPLPMLTCHMLPAPCRHADISSSPCMKKRQRALCVAVGGTCGAVMVVTNEPMSCCCARRNNSIEVSLQKTCPLSIESTAEKREKEGEGGLGERRGRKEHITRASALPSLQGEPPDIDDNEAVDNKTSRERVEDSEEFTEEQVTDTTVMEDIMAALVFLFVGAVLVLIKSRVFRITKKKQQEDREVESQETLVDETII